MDDADAVREYVLDSHRETLVAVLRCAEAIASDSVGSVDCECVADRERATDTTIGRALAAELERELRGQGVLAAFPALLAGGAAAAGYELPATPVAGPPYVAVTSVGPIARATLGDRRRGVAVEVFAVDRSERGERARRTYRACSPEEALDVRFRG